MLPQKIILDLKKSKNHFYDEARKIEGNEFLKQKCVILYTRLH